VASPVGSLVAVLRANVRPFTDGLKKATAKTSKFRMRLRKLSKGLLNLTASMGKLIKRVVKYGAALAAAAVVGVAALVVRQAKLIDSLAKTAQKLGLTADALQGLRLAAELSGVPIQQLDMAIQRMTRRVSEAALGMGEAQDALKELGLDAQKLNRLSPEQQFREIARAMKQVTNQADKVRLGFKLFDSEGVALINTLALGAERLEELERLVGDLGLSMSRLDTAGVEQMVDTWTEFRAIVGALVQKLTVELAPLITAAIRGMVDWGKEGMGAGEAIENAVGFATDSMARLLDVIQISIVGFKGMKAAALDAASSIARWADLLLPGTGALAIAGKGLSNAATDAAKDFGEALERLAKGGKWSEQMREAIKRVKEETNDIPTQIIEPIIEKAKEAVDAVKEVVEEVAETVLRRPDAAGTGVLARTAQGGTGAESPIEKINKRMEKLLQDIKDNQAEFAAQPVLIRWS